MEDEEILAEPPPNFITDGLSLTFEFLASYGWFVVVIGAFLYYVWYKTRDSLYSYVDSIRAGQQKKTDDGEIERVQLAREARLRRLQEDYNVKADIQAAKQAEIEEKKRQEKIEQWELHQRGMGYHSKIKAKEEESQNDAGLLKPGGKKKMRGNDYSPLMGGEGGSGWRRERPRPTAGGG